MCFQWGIPDVIEWLNEVPADVIDFWIAFDAVEPIGEQWRQTADTNSQLSQLAGLLALNYGIQFDAKESDDCMPMRYRRAKKRLPQVEGKQDPQSQFASVAASFGLTKVVEQYGRNNKPS